jgi:hypothetical protein
MKCLDGCQPRYSVAYKHVSMFRAEWHFKIAVLIPASLRPEATNSKLERVLMGKGDGKLKHTFLHSSYVGTSQFKT